MATPAQTPKTAAKLGYIASFQNSLANILRYKWHTGMLAWLLHRATGIGMMVYLVLHVFGLRALYNPVHFDELMSEYRSPLFKVGELLLLIGVSYHSVNGFRIVMIDFLGWSPQQKKMFYTTLGLSIVLVVLGGYPIVAFLLAK